MSGLPAVRAERALLRALAPIAGPFAVIASRSTDWSSATFEGARHRLALRLEGADARLRADRLAPALPEIELPLPAGFVADIAVTVRMEGDAPVLGIEALTIRDGVAEAAAIGLSDGGRRCG